MKEIEFTDDEFILLTDLTYKIAIKMEREDLTYTDQDRQQLSLLLNKIESVNHQKI